MGLRSFVQRHRRLTWATAVIAVAGAVFVVLWFEPHKLFIEETVDEAVPSVGASVEQGGGSAATPDGEDKEPNENGAAEPTILSQGDFQSLEHETTGGAQILELSDGTRFLRFEDLSTSNGPDLRVYLSEIPASDDWHAYGERFLDLGDLKGNRGDQNYEIPVDTDLSRYKSAVIWCRRFTVGFAVAPLT